MDLLRNLMLAGTGVVFVTVVVVAWRRARERRRRWKQDLCPACGYDVRGNSGRCPECGTPIRRFPRDGRTMVIPDERK